MVTSRLTPLLFPEFPVITGLLWSLCPPHEPVAKPAQNDGSPIQSDGTLSPLQVPGVPLRNVRVFAPVPVDCFPLRATVAEGTIGVGFIPRFLSSPNTGKSRGCRRFVAGAWAQGLFCPSAPRHSSRYSVLASAETTAPGHDDRAMHISPIQAH